MDETKFPPTFKGRQYELRAMGLREFAGLRRDDEELRFTLRRHDNFVPLISKL